MTEVGPPAPCDTMGGMFWKGWLAAGAVVLAGAHVASPVTAAPGSAAEHGTRVIDARVHQAMDTTNGPPAPNLPAGARPEPLRSARAALGGAGSMQTQGRVSAREVLGFAQSGEIASGAWRADLRLDLLTTVAYFGINVNGDGSLVTTDSGYVTWRSQPATDLINAAHAAGDRVVLTVKAFSNAAIAGLTESEPHRQTAIANILGQVASRSADGVNVDFEGTDGSVAASFTEFVAELRGALSAHLPNSAYLTVDTYASAASGGTMMDIVHLSPYVDAFDVMAYDITSPGSAHAGPVAPLAGMTYADVNTVSAYLALVAPSKVILGVPYYGYKWSVTQPSAQAPTKGWATADTYADVQADLACASQLSQHWDPTFATTWATWWSPPSGDPCGGNHDSWRELYYDNAASLGDKYDLVASRGLRGIGIWALGYDSGRHDLWDEIALKLTVASPVLAALPATENTTAFTVSWSMPPGSPPVAYFDVYSKDGNGPWQLWGRVANSQQVAFFGFRSRQYGFFVQAFTSDGRASGAPGTAGTTTTVSAGAVSNTPFRSLYAVDGYGVVHPASSPPLATTATWPGWNIVRGIALDGTGQGGVVADGWGGLHPLGDVASITGGGYWRGWDIVRGVASLPDGSGGWQLDGWGGLHPFGFGSSSAPPPATRSTYWGWDIARGVAAFSDGSGGVVLDGWGGVHPFTTGATVAAAPQLTSYWAGWDIARAITLIPGSTSSHYSGYVLDGWGGMSPFSSRGTALPPAVTNSDRWPGADVARGAVMVPQSQTMGYIIDIEGVFWPFGGAPPVFAPNAGISGPTVHSAAAS